jgi:uncharacterized protein YhaN
VRFDRLNLIKYGRFTERSIEFPAAKRDFHLIVGPNEAGKSTLRTAIQDLLFGIPPRTSMGFVHHLSDLRLGAEISNKAGSLAFHRTKGQKQTLRKADGVVLADTALAPYLGTSDRSFFEQMFGLDHTKLVEGGNSILSAENDVGQVLFQSAAGVASLGKVRDALIAEADKLWGPRRAADRAYFIAAAQLDKATSALKDATVRTKSWVDASHKVTELEDALEAERSTLLSMQARRIRLERVRRVAPFLRALKESEARLAELGVVVDLPADAAEILEKAERDLATSRQLLELRTNDVDQVKSALEAIHLDDAVLGNSDNVAALDEMRLKYSAHNADIERREEEVAVLWSDVGNACAQLKWKHESEEVLAAQLPTLLVRRELGRLARDHSGVVQALRAAEQAERMKRAEIERLNNEVAELPKGVVQPSLRAALKNARSLGDANVAIEKQQSALNKAQSTLDGCLQGLGQSIDALPTLMATQPPGQQTLSRMAQDRQTLVAEQRAAMRQFNEQKDVVARIELEISQFREQHHPTTDEAVLEARRERDASWDALKASDTAFQQGTQQFESALFRADGVADMRLDDVEEATELQSRGHELEREKQGLTAIAAECSRLEAALETLDTEWSKLLADLGLPSLSLEAIGDWLVKRQNVLEAEVNLRDTRNSFNALARSIHEAKVNLATALGEAGLQISENDNLAAYCAQAEEFIQLVDRSKTLGTSLSNQLATANALVGSLKQVTDEAKLEVANWSKSWSIALEKAGLPADSGVGAVEGALELIGSIEDKLSKMQQIRVERISAMRSDLNGFAAEATRLARSFEPEIQKLSPTHIAQELKGRLMQARKALAEADRLNGALEMAKTQQARIQESIQTANANLKPLMARANVDSNASLADAIARSDEHRRHLTDANSAKANLLEGGDGLDREQIEREVNELDLSQLGADLSQLEKVISDAVQRHARLTGEHANATMSLAQIGGSDAAATAEAQRQEALAGMSDAAERYVKVFAAGRLLRWAIDRYREEKQGPMLARAGAIFSRLTLGSFRKLVVDFDTEPMALEGQRPDGTLVGISGMSDGTADQLYLALRLAALELHLEQALPLPFIADDLFINYDDDRSKAGLEVLAALSEKTQVIFLSHHDHLVPVIQELFGKQVNVVNL